MSRRDDEDIAIGAMAASVFRAYRNSLGRSDREADWDSLEDDARAGWVDACGVALDILEDAQELPWTTLATRMFEAWARRLEYPTREYQTLGHTLRTAWVIAARHAVNLCALDGEDPTPHEERWTNMAIGLHDPKDVNA